MKTLILGMGNPILSDDGVGIHIVRRLEGRIPGADVATTAMIGMEVLDIVTGYDRIFLIDALATRGGTPGELKKLPPGEGTLHLFSSHGMNFFDMLEFGRRLGLKIPEISRIYGIEIGDDIPFGEEFTQPISDNLDSFTERILADIKATISA
jgi:hydrogenase maturation protease